MDIIKSFFNANGLLPEAIIFLLFIATGTIVAQEPIDWNGYKEWENTTVYTKTYVVDNGHIGASDNNPGTKDLPLKTIGKAAELAKPGERVVVYSGIYRETVMPKKGGKSESKMISYHVPPGEKVVVKGSKVYKEKWEQRKVFTDILPNPDLTYTWSRKTWMTTLPDNFFENGYYPLKLPNILPEEHKMMPWAKLVKEIPPYTSTRGLFFQDGKRMAQVVSYGDLTRLPGSFWVDVDGKTVHIHPFDSKDPNSSLIEVGVREHLFRPQKVGLNYIHLQGFNFEHCANGFLRTSTGAVTALGGHHWIIENNTIAHINSSGLEFGYYAFEERDPDPLNNPKRDREDAVGFNIVRNNHIYDCGTAGIRSFVVPDGIIKNNHIHHCGWQDAENYWECSGIKILVAHNTLLEGNHIHDIQGGNGIWLDWDIRQSRATKNIVYNVQNIQGGIFVEASHAKNLVDNNLVWNIDGNGIYANDTDYLIVAHNLVGKITGNSVHAIVQTDRYLNGRKLTAERNIVYNNIFVDGGPMRFSSDTNRVDNNLFVSTSEPNYFDLEASRAQKNDRNSKFIRAELDFNPKTLSVYINSEEPLPAFELLEDANTDFYNTIRFKETSPGPFKLLSNGIHSLKEKL